MQIYCDIFAQLLSEVSSFCFFTWYVSIYWPELRWLSGVQFLKQAGLFSLSLHLDHFLGYSDLHLVLKLRMHSILLHHFVLVPLLIHTAMMCSMLEVCVVGCIWHTGIEPPEQNCKCSTPRILNIM